MPASTEGVTITLNGSPQTLRFALGAAKKINGYFGGYVEAIQRIKKFDFDAITAVIAAGLGKEIKDVEDAVFSTGMDSLFEDAITYLIWMSAGGREPKPWTPDTKADSGNA
jgi:hypothetical protein